MIIILEDECFVDRGYRYVITTMLIQWSKDVKRMDDEGGINGDSA